MALHINWPTPAGVQDSYSRTRAAVRFNRDDGKYWVEIYGENLEDDEIRNQLEWRDSMPANWLYPPRHFGIKIGTNFM